MEDTWTSRHLEVLKAVVRLYEETGRAKIRVSDVAREANFDIETTKRALRALYTEPYFGEGLGSMQDAMMFVGAPTSAALRVAGQWPTPESMVERLIAAFEAAANDDDLDEPARTRAEKILDGLLSGGSKIAIAALGSAVGHYLYS